MPLYEYQCQSCGERSEVLQRFSDAPLTTCETCGGLLKKLVSAPAVQFKGEGWYVTDYADKGKKSKGGAKDDASSSDGGSSNGGEASSKSSSSGDGGSKSSSSGDGSSKKATSSTS